MTSVVSPPVPTQINPQFKSWLHGHCRHCNHLHDAHPIELSNDPNDPVSIYCKRCENKLFRIGRKSTQNSLISQETILSVTKDSPHRQLLACSNGTPDDVSANLSPHDSSPFSWPTDARTAHNVQDSKDARSGPLARFTNDVARAQKMTLAQNGPSEQDGENESLAPKLSNPQWQPEPSLPQGRRFKYLNRVTKRVGRLLGLDVQVTHTRVCAPPRKASSHVPPEVDPVSGRVSKLQTRRSAIDVLQAKPLQLRRSSRAQLSDSPTLQGPTPEDATNQKNTLATQDERPSLRDQRSSRHLRRVQELRQQRTKDARPVCQCDSECSCKQSSFNGIPEDDEASNAEPPSLIGSTSRTWSTSATSTTTTSSNTPSVGHFVRGVGAGFALNASRASLTLRRRSRQMSGLSRPSRLSSMALSNTSGSRPSSSSPTVRAIIDPSLPTLQQGTNRRVMSLEYIAPSHLPLLLNTHFTDDPQPMNLIEEDGEILQPRARSASSNNSMTPTQAHMDTENEFRHERHHSSPNDL